LSNEVIIMPMHELILRVAQKVRRFVSDSGGAAAVEFALIVPVLAGLVVAIDDVSSISTGTAAMQTASRAAIQYAMAGGTDMNAARTLGMQAWDQKPSDANMTVVQACLCATVVSDCNAPCPDNSVPTKWVTVDVQGTFGGNIYHRTPHLTERVRLR
jgi:Flp pilus assembly protein TadG